MTKEPQGTWLVSELLKQAEETLWRRIHHLVTLIWTQQKMPYEWSMGMTQPIYKKRDRLKCSIYRPISLLSVTYKVLSGVIYNRVVEYTEEH